MLISGVTGQFKRDFKKAESRGKDMAKLVEPMELITMELPLPASYKDHPLKGEYNDYRELHIEPDWLLIYRYVGTDRVLFHRTGTQSDLFKK